MFQVPLPQRTVLDWCVITCTTGHVWTLTVGPYPLTQHLLATSVLLLAVAVKYFPLITWSVL